MKFVFRISLGDINFWNIQLKIWKTTIIWWTKSKHIHNILTHVWYYPFPLRINDLIRFYRTHQKNIQCSPLTKPSASAIIQDVLHSRWLTNKNKILFDSFEQNNRLKQYDGRSLWSNITSESPSRTIFLFWISFTMSEILTKSERVSSCSNSVLPL